MGSTFFKNLGFTHLYNHLQDSRISYPLIEVETQDPNHVCPVDFDEAQYGLALFLNEITEQMVEICESVDKKME